MVKIIVIHCVNGYLLKIQSVKRLFYLFLINNNYLSSKLFNDNRIISYQFCHFS
jgi:hypothetical protein